MITNLIKDPGMGVEVNLYKEGILIGKFVSLEIYDSLLVILKKGIIEKEYCDIIDKELEQGLQPVIILHLPNDNPAVSPIKCIIKNIDKHHIKIKHRVVINILEAQLVLEP